MPIEIRILEALFINCRKMNKTFIDRSVGNIVHAAVKAVRDVFFSYLFNRLLSSLEGATYLAL